MRAASGSGLLQVDSGTAIHDVGGPPAPGFTGGTGTVAHCSDFPRVDAYFYPPDAYRGSTASLSTLDLSRAALGDCAAETTLEDGWIHFRLGTAAA